MNTIDQSVTEYLRPIRSATGAIIRAPANVPMESFRQLVNIGRKTGDGNTDKTDDEPGANVAEFLAVLGKAMKKVRHGEEAGDLTWQYHW